MMLSLKNLNDLLSALALLPSGDYSAKVSIDDAEDEERERKRITLFITGACSSIRIVRWVDNDNP